MKASRAFALILALAALCGATAGCGYRTGFLIPDDVKTIHVAVVENRTFWKEAAKRDNIDPAMTVAETFPAQTMEVDLTARIRNEVVRRTPLKLAPRAEADSVLEAAIIAVVPKTLLRDARDELLVQRVTIQATFTWTDRRSGRALARQRVVSRPTEFNRDLGENFTTAARRSLDYVAERIVEGMQESF